MAWPNAWPQSSAPQSDKLGLGADRAGRGDGPGHGPMQGESDPLRRGGRSPLACHRRDQRRAGFEHDAGSARGHRRARGPSALVHDARHRVRRRLRHDRDRGLRAQTALLALQLVTSGAAMRGQRACGTMAPAMAPPMAPSLAPPQPPSPRFRTSPSQGASVRPGSRPGSWARGERPPVFRIGLTPREARRRRRPQGVAPPCRRRDWPRA